MVNLCVGATEPPTEDGRCAVCGREGVTPDGKIPHHKPVGYAAFCKELLRRRDS